MTDLRTAAQQLLGACEQRLPLKGQAEIIDELNNLRTALAEPEGQREKEIEDLRFSLDFHQRRCEALQAWQSKMRDPERTIVCDILANGFTLDPAFAGDRYTAPPQRKPLTEEEIMQCFDEAVADYVDVSDAEMVDFARAI